MRWADWLSYFTDSLDSEQRISAAKLIKRFILNSRKSALIIEHDFVSIT